MEDIPLDFNYEFRREENLAFMAGLYPIAEFFSENPFDWMNAPAYTIRKTVEYLRKKGHADELKRIYERLGISELNYDTFIQLSRDAVFLLLASRTLEKDYTIEFIRIKGCPRGVAGGLANALERIITSAMEQSQ